MRSISTVHRPTPRASVSRVTISSSASRATTRREGTTPAAAFVAMSLMARTLARDSPAPRMRRGLMASTCSGRGKSSASKRATKRAKMAAAARPCSCW